MPVNWPIRTGSSPQSGEGYWTQAQSQPLAFAAPTSTRFGSTSGVTRRATWSTPLFDLRANLGLTDGYAQQRQKDVNGDVMLGVEFDLFVKLDLTFPSGTTLATGGPLLKFSFIEYGDPMDPNKQSFLNSPQDITTSVYGGYLDLSNQREVSALLRWTPPGPLRYWGVWLVVDDSGLPSPAQIQATAALH